MKALRRRNAGKKNRFITEDQTRKLLFEANAEQTEKLGIELEERMKKLQAEEETMARQFTKMAKKMRWVLVFVPILTTAFVFQSLSAWFVEQFAAKNEYDHLLDGFGIIQADRTSSERGQGRYIYAGEGHTPYTGYLNTLSRSLSDHQFHGYGFDEPTKGSIENIDILRHPESALSLAFVQKDAALYAQDTLGLDHFTVLSELPEAPEAAITISEKFSDYAQFEHAVEAAADTQTRTDDIQIGMLCNQTGSHVTALNILEPLRTQGYNAREFSSIDAMIDALQAREIDMACFVQYPGLVNQELVGGVERIIDENVPLMAMDSQSFATHFKNHAADYRRIQFTIQRHFNNAFPLASVDNLFKDDVVLPPLMAVNPLIIGRKVDLNENERIRHSAEKIHRAVTAQLRAGEKIPQDLPKMVEAIYGPQ